MTYGQLDSLTFFSKFLDGPEIVHHSEGDIYYILVCRLTANKKRRAKYHEIIHYLGTGYVRKHIYGVTMDYNEEILDVIGAKVSTFFAIRLCHYQVIVRDEEGFPLPEYASEEYASDSWTPEVEEEDAESGQ